MPERGRDNIGAHAAISCATCTARRAPRETAPRTRGLQAAAMRTASSPRPEAQEPLCTTARAERPGTRAMPNGERVFNISARDAH